MNILTNTSTRRGVWKNMSGGKVLTPKSAIFVTFYPKLCKFLQFFSNFAQILTFFPKIGANFDNFYPKLYKILQFLPKEGQTFSKNFRMGGKIKFCGRIFTYGYWYGKFIAVNNAIMYNNRLILFRLELSFCFHLFINIRSIIWFTVLYCTI